MQAHHEKLGRKETPPCLTTLKEKYRRRVSGAFFGAFGAEEGVVTGCGSEWRRRRKSRRKRTKTADCGRKATAVEGWPMAAPSAGDALGCGAKGISGAKFLDA